MISALRRYAESETIPLDAAMVMKSTEYLEVCNLFEKDILSKKIIRSMDSPVISHFLVVDNIRDTGALKGSKAALCGYMTGKYPC